MAFSSIPSVVSMVSPTLLEWHLDDDGFLYARVRGDVSIGNGGPWDCDYSLEGETTLDLGDHEPTEWPTTDAEVMAWIDGADFDVADFGVDDDSDY